MDEQTQVVSIVAEAQKKIDESKRRGMIERAEVMLREKAEAERCIEKSTKRLAKIAAVLVDLENGNQESFDKYNNRECDEN